jgi:hypothetical protein
MSRKNGQKEEKIESFWRFTDFELIDGIDCELNRIKGEKKIYIW